MVVAVVSLDVFSSSFLSFSNSAPICFSVSVRTVTAAITGGFTTTASARFPTTFSAQLMSFAGVLRMFRTPEIRLSPLLPLAVLEHSLGGSGLSGRFLNSVST